MGLKAQTEAIELTRENPALLAVEVYLAFSVADTAVTEIVKVPAPRFLELGVKVKAKRKLAFRTSASLPLPVCWVLKFLKCNV